MDFVELQKKVEGLSAELTALFPLYFPKIDYPDLDLSDEALNRNVAVTIYQFFSDCNRYDLPAEAKIPLLKWVVQTMRYEVHITDVFNTNNPDLAKTERPTERIDIKSTTVIYGKSDADELKSDKKKLYQELKQDLYQDWWELVVSYRKVRW